MSNKEAYEERMRANIKVWQAEIDKLKAQADRANADAKITYDEQLAELRGSLKTAREKLDAMRNASQGAWEQMKSGLESAADEMSRALDRSKEALKEELKK